jgi:outer membrane protein
MKFLLRQLRNAALITTVLLLCVPPAAMGQASGAPARIGFVDFDRVFSESAVGKKSHQELEGEMARYNRDLEKMTLDARTLQEDLDRNAVTLSDSDKRGKERDIRALNSRFEQKKAEYTEDYEVRRREAVDGMVRRIQQAVEKIAAEEKLDVIVNRAVAVSQAADVTLQVIRKIDEEAQGK